jgi:hypothetical protein
LIDAFEYAIEAYLLRIDDVRCDDRVAGKESAEAETDG